MKTLNMEGGYINEDDEMEPVTDDEGGQLKSKNGQKYVVNSRKTNGYYISRGCAALLLVGAIFAMLFVFLLTYFLVQNGCSGNEGQLNNFNDTIHHAGTLQYTDQSETQVIENGHGKPPTTLQTSTAATLMKEKVEEENEAAVVTEKEIILYEGWNPINYKLLIEPNFVKSTNNGTITIRVTRDLSIKNVQPIVLDINNIEVIACQVNDTTGKNVEVKTQTSYGVDNQTYHITLAEASDSIRNLTITLDFVSQLTNTLQGFYKGSYTDERTGDLNVFASTQFSPIDAKRAFPCFDRPDKKATFEISLVRPVDKKTFLSNMPHLSSSEHRPGYVREDFEKTPKMSTYIVAFIVSNFERAKINNDVIDVDLPRIDMWSRKEVTDMTHYGYDLTVVVLKFLQNYFGINFRLPKIDIVAVPDFGFNAMENWGLITYRESALLVPENKNGSSARHVERVSSVIAHELAHQWFGNLVTPKWWDELWLKEGFSTYMSYVTLQHVEPSWQMMDMFTLNELRKAMEIDGDNSTHPISFDVKLPSDVRRIFDPISYSKGATIIRMLQSFLGEDTFKKGITKYLIDYSYSNSVQDNLWAILTELGHEDQTFPQDMDIKEVMGSWTQQSGYPIVNVSRVNNSIIITQHKYSLPKLNMNDTAKWYIPITYSTGSSPKTDEIPQYWLSNTDHSIEIPNAVGEDEYLYLNVNRTGYYRVSYDLASWKQIIKHFNELPAVTRSQLVDDAFNLARAEVVPYDIPLTFLILIHTDDILSWISTTSGISYITNMIMREPAYESFRGIMRIKLKEPFMKYGLEEEEDDSHLTVMHRARIAKLACHFEIAHCTNPAQLKYREWMSSPVENKISPNLKETIYCTSLREGGVSEWMFAHKNYLETSSASEKEIILDALGCTRKSWLLSKYLNMTISAESGIRKQDGNRAFSSVARNIVGYEIAFDFLYSNIEEIVNYYGDGFSVLSKMIDSLTTFMNKELHKEQLQRLTTKVRKLGLFGIEKSIKLSELKVDNNIFWRSRSYYNLKNNIDQLIKDMNININS